MSLMGYISVVGQIQAVVRLLSLHFSCWNMSCCAAMCLCAIVF